MNVKSCCEIAELFFSKSIQQLPRHGQIKTENVPVYFTSSKLLPKLQGLYGSIGIFFTCFARTTVGNKQQHFTTLLESEEKVIVQWCEDARYLGQIEAMKEHFHFVALDVQEGC